MKFDYSINIHSADNVGNIHKNEYHGSNTNNIDAIIDIKVNALIRADHRILLIKTYLYPRNHE